METAIDPFIHDPAGQLSVRSKELAAKPAQVVVSVHGADLSAMQTGRPGEAGWADAVERLAIRDTALVMVPNSDNRGDIQHARHRMWTMMANFLDG